MGYRSNKRKPRVYDQGRGNVGKASNVNVNPYDVQPYNPSGPGGIGHIDPKKDGDCPYPECQGLSGEMLRDCCYGQCDLDPNCVAV